ILAPNANYREQFLDPSTLLVGTARFRTPGNGSRFTIPRVILDADIGDADHDGLGDLGENVVGTDPSNPDTDGDGVLDGAEVQQGTNPLDGLPAATGIIASVDTPGTAVDVCALNDVAVVADSDHGISVFNVFNGMTPTIVAQVDTPGIVTSVACDVS